MENKIAATKVLKKLTDQGYLALFAGGCVRDMLLDRTPQDYDIATNAHPEIVSSLFRRTIEVGAQFGVVMVMIGDIQIEVATFRTESGYVDGRRPGKVDFTDAKHDALRRDFTINGMFYDPLKDKVIDYVDGQKDLAKQTIKTIGSADERFGEDYLRMLRAIRFATQLNFEIDPETWDGIRKKSDRISQISGERIAVELEKTFGSEHRAKGAKLLVQSDLAKAIFPKIKKDQFNNGIKIIEKLQGSVPLALALACLMSDCTDKLAAQSCKTLKLSKKQNTTIKYLLENKGEFFRKNISLAQLKTFLANEDFPQLLQFHIAMQKANNLDRETLQNFIEKAEKLKGCELKPAPILNGFHIIEAGVKPGPMVGQVANELYTLQLNEEITNKDEAIKWVKNWLSKHS